MSDSSESIPGVLQLFSLLHWDIKITKKRDGFLQIPTTTDLQSSHSTSLSLTYEIQG